MNKKLDTINNSAALGMGRSQHVGTAVDDTIIMEFKDANVINVGGDESPYALIMQKLVEGQNAIEETGLATFETVHLPKQITILSANAFIAATRCKKINLENVITVADAALAALATENEEPIVLRLDSVEEIAVDAFAEANAIIHLNKNVRYVEDDAFRNVKSLHYSGNLEGAPWGALEWIKD